jgi:hypothetical protein
MDLGTLQPVIDETCQLISGNPCPALPMPTLSQAILEYAGITNLSPEVVRSQQTVPVGNYVDAGNPSHPPAVACTDSLTCDPLNPFTFPIDPSALSMLRPIAFTSAGIPTQLFDPSATMFVYAVGGSSAANAAEPNTFVMFYDATSLMTPSQQNQTATTISIPLTVLNSDLITERFVPAVLKFKFPAAGNAPCSASTITGDFAGTGLPQTLNDVSTIGVNCAAVFAKSPASQQKHVIFEVTAKLLITQPTDPVFPFPFGFLTADLLGSKPANCPGPSPTCILGTAGQYIGVAPSAGPLGSPSTTTSATYPLCASVPTNNSGQTRPPSAAAFYVIAADSEVFLSAALAPAPLSNGKPAFVCPF